MSSDENKDPVDKLDENKHDKAVANASNDVPGESSSNKESSDSTKGTPAKANQNDFWKKLGNNLSFDNEKKSDISKLKIIFVFGWLMWALDNFTGISGNTGFFLLLNLAFIAYASGEMGTIVSLLAGGLTYFHGYIFDVLRTTFSLNLQEYLLPIYYPFWVIAAYYVKNKDDKANFFTKIAIIYFIIFGVFTYGLDVNLDQFVQSDSVKQLREEQSERASDSIKKKFTCTVREWWYGEDFKLCMNPVDDKNDPKAEKSRNVKNFDIKISEPSDFKLPIITNPLTTLIPATLHYESVDQNVDLKVSCKFIKNSVEVSGIAVTGNTDNIIKIRGDDIKKIRINCKPFEELDNGNWKTEFIVDVDNVTTVSRLPLLFVESSKQDDEIKRLRETFIDPLYSFTKNQYKAIVPGTDLSYVSFSLGTEYNNPIIKVKDDLDLQLDLFVVNNGNGKIKTIEQVDVNLYDGFKSKEPCFGISQDGNNLNLEISEKNFESVRKNKIALNRVCIVSVGEKYFEDPLNNFESTGYINTDFTASVKYSYQIKRNINIRVAKPR